MRKMRIYEYAKEKNMASREVIQQLKDAGVQVSNHMSVIDEATIQLLEKKQQPKQGTKDNSQDQKKESPSNKKAVENRSQESSKATKKRSGQQQSPQKQQQTKQKKKTQQRQNNYQPAKPKQKKLPEKITFTDSLTVAELAKKLYQEPAEIIKKLMTLGVMATINQSIDKDIIELIAAEYGVEAEEEIVFDITDIESYVDDDKEEDLKERPPVVTIMGHVDHGKTTLLDSIRKTKVTEGEAGGITQHIGAYQIETNEKKITFLDTPGHAAFTTMRARGAQVTDITILVVAADDGVMPQTKEAINHAKAANVPIIIAVNKIDKETANPDRVMQELTEFNLVPEAWGGDTIFVNVSALTGTGIDELLEMVQLIAEMEELKANPNKLASGTVIEAELDKGRGVVATLLVQAGTLKVGDPIVVGSSFGRVRAMVNDIGRRVKEVGPSTPVEITGLNEVPLAGDQFRAFPDERTARQIGEARMARHREESLAQSSKVSLDDLFNQIQEGDVKEINIIIKADVQGAIEAMRGSLEKIEVEGVKINVIHTGVGAITEYDVMLASASNAIIVGFNVRPDVNANRTATEEKVDIRLHRVIYDAIDEIEQAMKGVLDPEYEEKVIGQVEVRTIFKVSKVGTIAGSYVTDGKITRDANARLVRDGIVIHEGPINALKRFKDDAREVAAGYECGITLENYNDIKEGDIIEAYVMEEIERK